MRRLTLCGLLWLLAAPAWAGFDTTLYGPAAFNLDGTVCGTDGTVAGRNGLPRCIGTGGVGTMRFLTHAPAGSAPTFTVNRIAFSNLTEPDATAASSWIVECTALAPGADGHGTITWGTDATVAVDLDATATCDQIDETCISGASSATAIRNELTDADCSGTACANAPVVCQVSYVGNGADVDDTADLISIDLTFLP